MQDQLLQKLSIYISFNKASLKCFATLILSILETKSISMKSMAICLSGSAKLESKIHKIYRFFRDTDFNYNHIADFIISMFVQGQYIIAIDRSNWKFGKKDINILFVVIVIGKISVPIYWNFLDHGGASDSKLMKHILSRFIRNFGLDKIKYLLADREFMNKAFLDFLTKNKIKFVVPLKSDTKIRLDLLTLSVKRTFSFLHFSEYTEENGYLWGYKVKFVASRNAKGELMVLVHNCEINIDVFALYKYRWSIERLFKHLKTGGFDIEKSHITDFGRFAKLLAITGIAAAIIIKNGVIQSEIKEIRLKKFKNRNESALYSLFTYGFDNLKNAINHHKDSLNQLMKSILDPPKPQLILFINNLLNFS